MKQPRYEQNLVAYQEADEFTRAYIDCALWLADPTPGSGQYTVDEDDIMAIYPDDLQSMINECITFQQEHKQLLDQAYQKSGYSPARAGHDFYLTRNHHGAGFWDRGLDQTGDDLTDAAHAYGESDLLCEQGDSSEYDKSKPRAFYL